MDDRALNGAYSDYCSTGSLDLLLQVARTEIIRSTRDEDRTQEALVRVFEGLASFHPKDDGAFARWVSRIIRFTKLSAVRDRSVALGRSVDDFDEFAPSGDVSFVDISQLPTKIRVIADGLLRGETMIELAERTGVKVTTLRKRLRLFREKGSPMAA